METDNVVIQPVADQEVERWNLASDPAYLFMAWWEIAASWSPADRSIIPRPSLKTREEIRLAVSLDDGKKAVSGIIEAIKSEWPVAKSYDANVQAAGLILEGMRSVDEIFTQVHPRTRMLPPIYGKLPILPAWVDGAHIHRQLHNCFAETPHKRLIPNGPFARHGRGRDASSADSLQDQFPILTLAPKQSTQEDRGIEISMKVISTDVMRGVPSVPTFGREKVSFIPLAEAKNDLEFVAALRAERHVLDVKTKVDTASRLLAALEGASDVDVAFAPELTLPGSNELSLASGITALALNAPRIILAGTGLSEEKAECGRSWNEARVYARGGHILWKQRKIWPFGMQRERALGYGLPDPGIDETLMEDIAGHSEITVVDMDGFGRCLILICQDIESRPLVDEIVARYQPDWIFTPVLDPGVDIPGWAHQRAFMLSKLAQSRILIGSSLTLSFYSSGIKPEPPVGLAVGPAEPTVDLNEGAVVPKRAVALVHAAAGSSPRSGSLVWDYSPPLWRQSTVEST